MKKIFKLVSISMISTSMLLTGCGGGGSASVRSTSFSSFSAINPPEAIAFAGMTREADYSAPAPAFLVTSVNDLGVSQTSSATLTYGSSGSLDKITINTPNSTVTWNTADGDTIDTFSGVIIGAENSAGTNVGIAIDPTGIPGWDYQTFGVWITGLDTGSGRVGTMSIGSPTAGSAIPGTGTPTFTGLSTGVYVDSSGEGYMAIGELTVLADFSNRSLAFATRNTEKISLNSDISSAADNLDMIGTLRYSAGVNSFSGPVSATGLTGTAEGRFYGPSAQELGGVFSLSADSGIESYIGGYGATQ